MARQNRIIASEFPYHVTQRGNNKSLTFLCDDDYVKYLSLLEKYKNIYSLEIYDYSLMPNHIHLECVPRKIESLSKTLQLCQMCYAQYFNKKYQHIGHLWQSRFFSCLLDQNHLYNISKYIETNPVRAGLVKKAEDWPWSSARDHLNISNGHLSLSPIENLIKVDDWSNYLEKGLKQSDLENIQKHTFSGKPLGDEPFIKKIEKICKKSLKRNPIGRPRM